MRILEKHLRLRGNPFFDHSTGNIVYVIMYNSSIIYTIFNVEVYISKYQFRVKLSKLDRIHFEIETFKEN